MESSMNVLQNVVVEIGEENVDRDRLVKLVKSIFVELPVEVDYEYLALVKLRLLLALIFPWTVDGSILVASPACALLRPQTGILVLLLVK